ncbi:hypothetical protein EXIGLDRAFT_248354 [Exidia glandulosa HHB12029]|uniref:DUF6533 domain-containing protein n=1 Tax=Exidia glandulosa HHB12029 TaxID=1314781 RepID=A0A165QC31_EXIGL|nr:hypothetical protein EXIGLDRAFT_248354 [Exidia glandulosa HHB12029]
MDMQHVVVSVFSIDMSWKRYWVATFSLIIWDWIISLDFEIERIWKSRKWSTLSLWFFVRYWPILQTLVEGIFYFGTFSQSVCRLFSPFPSWALFVEMGAQHAVFVMRTYALYRCDRRVLAALVLLVLAEVAVYLRALTRQFFMGNSPLIKALGHCLPSMLHESDGLLIWATSSAIDVTVLLLTLVRTIQLHRKKDASRSIVAIMLRDGVAYFGIITLCNIANIIMFKMSTAGQVNPIQFATTVSSILTPRLILNLRGANRTEADEATRANINGDATQAMMKTEANFATLTALDGYTGLDYDEDAARNDRRIRRRADDIEYLSG